MAASFPTAIKTYTALVAGGALPYDTAQSYQDEVTALETTFFTGKWKAVLTNDGTQSINDATFTAVTWVTEEIDTDSLHSIVSNTSRVTIPTGGGGYWRFKASIFFAANATGVRAVQFKKNGTTLVGTGGAAAAFSSASLGPIVIAETVISVAAADYIEVLAFQNSGGALNIGAASSAGANRYFQNQLIAERDW